MPIPGAGGRTAADLIREFRERRKEEAAAGAERQQRRDIRRFLRTQATNRPAPPGPSEQAPYSRPASPAIQGPTTKPIVRPKPPAPAMGVRVPPTPPMPRQPGQLAFAEPGVPPQAPDVEQKKKRPPLAQQAQVLALTGTK